MVFYKEDFKPVCVDEICTGTLIYSFYDINFEITKLYLYSGCIYVIRITKTNKSLFNFLNVYPFQSFIRKYPTLIDTKNTDWTVLHEHIMNLINFKYMEKFIPKYFINFTNNIYTICNKHKYEVKVDSQTNKLIMNGTPIKECDYFYYMIKEFHELI